MKSNMFDSLCETLTRQLEVQERLLELSLKKRVAVIKSDSAELSGIVQSELKELSKMTAAEKDRVALMPSIAESLDIPETATLSEIIAVAPPDKRAPLDTLKVKLASITSELKNINAENKKLIENQLEYSEAILNLYTPDDPYNNIYGEDGQYIESETRSARYLDWQV